MRPAGLRLIRAAGFSLLWSPRLVWIGAGLVCAVLVLAIVHLGTGRLTLGPGQILSALLGTSDDPIASRILQAVRLPRVLTAASVGAALGLSGAVFQSLSRNPLGSPDVIGFTTGAASGAIAQIILGGLDPIRTAIAAIGSGLATAAAVLLLARRGPAAGGSFRLILVGIGMGAILGGLNTVLLAKGDIDRVMAAQVWLAGSLNARGWDHVLIAAGGLALFAPIVVLLGRRLSLMELGTDMARQLGVPVGITRSVLVLAAVGLSSVGTAAAGPIAFVALAAPQIARRLARAPGVPLFRSAAIGAGILLAADLLGQAAPFALALPIGLTTGLLGGLYLLLVVSRAR